MVPRPALRIVEDLKPQEVLSSGALLEQFRHQNRQYEAFMEQNKEAYTKQGIKFARAYFENSIDARLSTYLAILRNEEGMKKINEVTAKEMILCRMQELYMEVKPMWVQRIKYFIAVQGKNELFQDFWAHKTVIKEN